MSEIIENIGQFFDTIIEIILGIADTFIAFFSIIVRSFNGLISIINGMPGFLAVYFYISASIFIIYLIINREGGNK